MDTILGSAVRLAGAVSYLAMQTIEAGSWTTNSPLNNGRSGHAAVLLTSGQVLVAGGADSTFADTASAELFEPATGAWTNTNPMSEPRLSPTLTRLTNGLVLVTGGQAANGGSSTTELYNHNTGLWETNADLNVGRHAGTATLLADGKVLVAGGYAGLNPGDLEQVSAEIFDPNTRNWTLTGSLSHARWGHTATALRDGRVLVVGGVGSNNILSSAEIYDPSSGKWTSTSSMEYARRLHSATLLENGKVLVAGGMGDTNDTQTAELYDPASQTWKTTSMNLPRNAHTATLMTDGSVLIAGGWSSLGEFAAEAEVFEPTSETWRLNAPPITARSYHTSTLLNDGRVLIAGGFSDNGVVFSTELYLQAAPFLLNPPAILPNGVVQIGFTNLPGLSFTMLATPNLALPLTNWLALGGVTEISPGQFQFTDTQATNTPQRFYRVRAN